MPNIHIGQTAVRLEFTTGIELHSAREVELRYYKPNTVMGRFPAQILDAEKGIVFYDVQSEGDLDDTGFWRFWVHVTFDDGTELDSGPIQINIYEPGKRYISHPYGRMSIDGGILMAIEAFRVIYNNNISKLNADDVQAALDEIKNLIDTLSSANISYSGVQSSLNSNNVKAALDELKQITDTIMSNLGAEFENTIYVAKNGSDTEPASGVPLGTIDNPYLTVQAAIDSIEDASETKHYSIVVQPGLYEENLTMKPWVNIVGTGSDNTKIYSAGTHTLWFSAGGSTKIKSIDFGSQPLVVTHPLHAPGECNVFVTSCKTGSITANFLGAAADSLTIKGNTTIKGNLVCRSSYLRIFNSIIDGLLSIDDTNSQHQHISGYDSVAYIQSSTIESIVASGNSLSDVSASKIKSTVTIDGPTCLHRSDAVSLPRDPADVLKINDGELEKTTGAGSIAYDNSVSGLSATDIQSAIDELRTMI